MLFTYGSEKIEIRPWGLENSGKALLVTTSEAVKEELLKTRETNPEWVELMTDPEIEVSLDDTEGAMMAVVSRENVALFFDLEKMKLGICTYAPDAEEE